jgi:uncharacterized protein YheU (UPF0270 family)
VARVQQALKRRDAVIAFDSEHQQCQLLLRSEVPREWLEDYLSDQDAE